MVTVGMAAPPFRKSVRDSSGSAEIIAEIGVDMAVFRTAQRLAAWAGVSAMAPASSTSVGQAPITTKVISRRHSASSSAVALADQHCPAWLSDPGPPETENWP
jgi:Transposase IS116/IS110/IS902 family